MNQCRNTNRANGAIPKRQTGKITYRRDKENKMDTIINVPRHIKLAGAMLAMAALVITLLVVNFAAGPAQAQESTTPPKPCGPGANSVPDSPDPEISDGHHAVFDAYWWPLKEGVDGSGTLNNNLCPPRVTHTKTTDPETRKTTTTHHLYASNIDIGTTVFRVPDVAKRSLTDALLEKYPALEKGLTASDYQDGVVDNGRLKTGDDAPRVWWLQPDTPGQPIIGFSAYRFDGDHWHLEGSDTPIQYEFEAVREPGIPPTEYGHFFVFDDEDEIPAGTVDVEAIWDSYDTDTNELKLEPGDVEHFQWVFTKPGYYVLSVHMKAHVRETCPDPDDQAKCAAWQRLTEDEVVTSEVKQYTFYVGDKTPNHPPRFQMRRSVPENSPAGTAVGKPVTVAQGDDDPLTYTLSGPGHSIFSVETTSDGDAQIKTGADSHRHLDYELRSAYDLVLGVSDCKDVNGKKETPCQVDATQSIQVRVADVKEAPGVTIEASQTTIKMGETLYIYASLGDPPAGASFTGFEFQQLNPGYAYWKGTNTGWTAVKAFRHGVGRETGNRRYQVWAYYNPPTSSVLSDFLTVNWVNP